MVFALAFIGPPARAAVCDSTSKGYSPLSELGSGTYLGHPGGLYPGGGNAPPPAHAGAGAALAASIAPLDTLGAPSTNGAIVLLSIGMSNTAQEYSAFVPLVNAFAGKNPRVIAINGAQGGQTASVFADPLSPAWEVVDARLRLQGFAPKQVQVVWLKQANARPTAPFPTHAELLRDDLRAVARNLRARYENVRLCYLSSRIYGGYASTTLNPEPFAYESGFAVRWLIEEQLNGAPELNFDPDAGPVNAPWLAWGPYLWADGLRPRADGLTWACTDFVDDGTHPSASGRDKVAGMLLEFFATEPTATPWFLVSSTGSDPHARGVAWSVGRARPNPFSRDVSLTVDVAVPQRLTTGIFAVSGRRIRRLVDATFAPGRSVLRWDGTDDSGGRASAGLYFIQVAAYGGDTVASRIVFVP
jgi:hypothetical protein